MGKKLEKAIKAANEEIKKKFFSNHQITMENGIFINLSSDYHHFPIGDAENEEMAIAIIKAYVVGLNHAKSPYVKLCDEE